MMSGPPRGSDSPASRLLGIVTGSWTSQATYVAARLGIPDILADGPKWPAEVAALANAHPDSLHRLLRALTTIDICRERDDGSFELTDMGSLLRSGAPDSLRSWTIFWGGHLWPIWEHLLHSVTTGESARKLVLGTEGSEHLERDPDGARVFHDAMAELTRTIAEDVVRAYDFSGVRRIVDVGGGYGEMLATILQANPATTGVLVDLPHGIENAGPRLEAAGVASRCDLVAGDFFESVPAGGDAYLLKSVLHDWNDERGRVILENCRRAMSPQGKILLVERVVPERLEATPEHQALARSDLHMLVAWAARERTELELRELLGAAGFRVTKIVPIRSTFFLIEGAPLA